LDAKRNPEKREANLQIGCARKRRNTGRGEGRRSNGEFELPLFPSSTAWIEGKTSGEKREKKSGEQIRSGLLPNKKSIGRGEEEIREKKEREGGSFSRTGCTIFLWRGKKKKMRGNCSHQHQQGIKGRRGNQRARLYLGEVRGRKKKKEDLPLQETSIERKGSGKGKKRKKKGDFSIFGK